MVKMRFDNSRFFDMRSVGVVGEEDKHQPTQDEEKGDGDDYAIA